MNSLFVNLEKIRYMCLRNNLCREIEMKKKCNIPLVLRKRLILSEYGLAFCHFNEINGICLWRKANIWGWQRWSLCWCIDQCFHCLRNIMRARGGGRRDRISSFTNFIDLEIIVNGQYVYPNGFSNCMNLEVEYCYI